MTLDTAQIVFCYFAGASVISALLAVTRRNPVHSMLWLLALFLHVAGLYLLLGAEFLAVVQVIVYAGAILVFYLFVQMLLDVPGDEQRPRYSAHWPLAAAGGLSLAGLALLALSDGALWLVPESAPPQPAHSDVRLPEYTGSLTDVGKQLFRHFAVPFELASLVLLAAIVGAVVLAGRRVDGS